MTEALRKFSNLVAQSAIARKANTKNSAFTPEQIACVDRLESQIDRVLTCKRRDMHLRTLCHCIASYSDADMDEPLTADVFNVYECYRVYTQELVYFPDKFDFIIYCILNRVCMVQKPRKFMLLLDDLLLPATAALAERVGGQLLHRLIREDEKKDDDERARIESFTLKKDWVKRRHQSRNGGGGGMGMTLIVGEDDEIDDEMFIR